MDDHQTQIEIQKQLRDKRDKFVYYIMALCVASIAFSVTQTAGQKLTCIHVFIGGAIICWMGSIFFGFSFIQNELVILIRNSDYFDQIAGRVGNLPKGPTLDKAASKVLREHRDRITKKATLNFRWQQYLFYIGLGLFLIWHIIQMSKN